MRWNCADIYSSISSDKLLMTFLWPLLGCFHPNPLSCNNLGIPYSLVMMIKNWIKTLFIYWVSSIMTSETRVSYAGLGGLRTPSSQFYADRPDRISCCWGVTVHYKLLNYCIEGIVRQPITSVCIYNLYLCHLDWLAVNFHFCFILLL